MSDSIMQSELLVDLSTEQEEAIAGGLSIGNIDGIDLANKVNTGFSEQKLATVSDVQSGPGGSRVTRATAASNTNTFANDLFKIALS
ncbi:CTB family bacteriocin [Nostocaceae cyanobacterium CENA369]|uniref:CTB family bacteriocin n=1 Tax=Dendronalium phyllosphericum CENA369 TaxID=1725256 RepID=A0A8J7LIV7_9NOST|nr:CTB family bacteriocin [Dendronalium phyllosphericum]MBH8575184.1 CTB family bacteriocin [Dendronalium phyllosphericum CENA369]